MRTDRINECYLRLLIPLRMKKPQIWIALLFLALSSCSDHTEYTKVNTRFSTTDPFAKTSAPSKFVEFSAEIDTVLAGENGLIIVIPKGALLNAKNEVVQGKITMELFQANGLNELVFSNLTGNSSSGQLSGGGAFYINFTKDNEQLHIDQNNPITISTPKTAEEMLMYSGNRDSVGNMDWVDPIAPEKYLDPVPLSTLNFTPEIFDNGLLDILPFEGKNKFVRSFSDSLYYSVWLVHKKLSSFTPDQGEKFLLEPNGKKFDLKDIQKSHQSGLTDTSSDDEYSDCGIDPIKVKTIKENAFENTFIATKEFETRMQAIHRTFDQRVLDLYVNNTDKQLWVVDSMASQLLANEVDKEVFLKFSREKLTNVRDVEKNPSAKALARFYQKRSEGLTREMDTVENALLKKYKLLQKDYDKELAKYVEVLRKREAHRMLYFNYTLTSSGWKYFAIPPEFGRTFREKKLIGRLTDSQKFDMVNVYVWMPENTSLMRLTETEKNVFISKSMRAVETTPVLDNTKLQFFAVAVIGEQYFFDEVKLSSEEEREVTATFELKPTEKAKIDAVLGNQEGKADLNNSISRDLKFQTKRLAFNKAADKYLEKRTKYDLLFSTTVNNCCRMESKSISVGNGLFNKNCARCHSAEPGFKLTGPAFDNFRNYSPGQYAYFSAFVRDSRALINSGDDRATTVFNEYRSVMPAFEDLKEEEIMSIYNYLIATLSCSNQPTILH